MQKRKMVENVYGLGGLDWDRRLFDALIPIPDGTTYNAYLVQGSEKTALIDAVDPAMMEILWMQLKGVEKIDYIVSLHSEQDHSGAFPELLRRYPSARVVTNPKGKELLMLHLHLPESVFITVADGETLSLGDKTLEFIYTPWVHWPETMSSYLQEDGILFSCDFFGSHIADASLFVIDQPRVYEAAKRYYAEIMTPFRPIVAKNLDKLSGYDIRMIAPSHGQVYDKPAWILDAYREWVSAAPRNKVTLPYISMHGSTQMMVDRLISALTAFGVRVEPFNLAVADIGLVSMSLVDAGTIVMGTPTVLAGPHPKVAYAALLANAFKPKAKYFSVIGSYGWGGKSVETLVGLTSNFKVERLDPVLCKGLPTEEVLEAIDQLAHSIAEKHRESGLEK